MKKENERKDYDASCFIKVYVIYTKKRTCELRIVELMIKEWVTNNGIKKKEKEKKKKGIFSSRRFNGLGLNCLVFVAK